MAPAMQAGLCVPRFTGELILFRQTQLLTSLNCLVEEILDAASPDEEPEPRSKKPEKAAQDALSTLSLEQKPEKLTVADLTARAFDQKSAFEDYLQLCRTEPAFLTHVVNICFFSQPELIPDEKGRALPVITDKYISKAVFEALHNAVIQAAVWGYIYQLQQALVKGPNDRIYKGIVLQELSNVCDFEYRRSQKLFKRYIAMIAASGYFKRISDLYDESEVRVRIKARPDILAKLDSQVYYMFRLCQPETTFSSAIDWIRKVGILIVQPVVRRDFSQALRIDTSKKVIAL